MIKTLIKKNPNRTLTLIVYEKEKKMGLKFVPVLRNYNYNQILAEISSIKLIVIL